MNNEHGEMPHHEPQPLNEILNEWLDTVDQAYKLRERAQELLDAQLELIHRIEKGVPESPENANQLTMINDKLRRMFEGNPETPHDPDK